jgi:hypothetical protein
LFAALAPFGDSAHAVTNRTRVTTKSAARRCPNITMKPSHQFLVFTALVGFIAACGDSKPGEDASRSAYQDPAETPRYADADRNGRVTRDEADVDPALAAHFERYDANSNGELDRGEFARLEAGSTSGSSEAGKQTSKEDEERHTLRPRREFPRPLD